MQKASLWSSLQERVQNQCAVIAVVKACISLGVEAKVLDILNEIYDDDESPYTSGDIHA